MCGIVGFTGTRPAQGILIEGLSRLEYRGYDSAGVAIYQDGKLEVVHRKGKVSSLAHTLGHFDFEGACGIGHTRWATHGRPSEANAHPHTSCDGRIAVVHNGIIENFADLREELQAAGHSFTSDTDTEVVPHLVEQALRDGAPDLLSAVRAACERLVGAYALAVVSADEPGTIVATRKDSPLGVGQGAEGAYVASDIIAMIDATRDVVIMNDGELAKLTPEGVTYYTAAGQVIEDPRVTHVDWNLDVAEKGGYPDFMLKEIHEQPRVIRDTLAGRLVGGALSIDELDLSVEELNLIDRVYIIACGTSYHAGLIAKNLIEGWARIPCECEVASEFRYRNPITPTTLVVAVSQSGETADTLAAIRDARVKGARVFGITNVVGSPVARESDGVIYTKANKEIAVASTKSFLGQVVSLTLLAMLLAQVKGKLKMNQIRLLFRELADTAEQVERILAECGPAVEEAAQACKDARSALFVGRGMGAAVSREGALKLKEISYLHAESYPAGEMKHGPIALIDEGFPVIAVATKSPVYDKLVSNLQESKARGAMVVAIATEGDEEIRKHADHVIYIPKVRDAFSAITASVPLQLLARAIAVARGCDVDQPRNLAKSVTVE